jgi:hypothetical protein
MHLANGKKPAAEQNKRKQYQYDKSRRYYVYQVTGRLIHLLIS